jgi:hypothetical protein
MSYSDSIELLPSLTAVAVILSFVFTQRKLTKPKQMRTELNLAHNQEKSMWQSNVCLARKQELWLEQSARKFPPMARQQALHRLASMSTLFLSILVAVAVCSTLPSVCGAWTQEEDYKADVGGLIDLHASIADDNMGPPDTKLSSSGSESTEIPTSYGVDVSFPIHSKRVSENYAWLPHNVDPEHHPTPHQFVGVPVQPLGNRQALYDEFMQCKSSAK